MPTVRIPTAGNELVASAAVTRLRKVTVAAGTTEVLEQLQLQCNNLPNIFVWIYQTSGVAGLVYAPQFAVDNVTSGGVVVPNWLPLTTFQAIFLNTPSFVNLRVIANMITIEIGNPTASDAELQIVLAASQ